MAVIASAFGSNPVGAAGGSLSGTYPNPGLGSAPLLAQPGAIPADIGLQAWTFDPVCCANAFLLVSGTIYLYKVYTRAAFSCTNVLINISTAGSGLTAAQNLAGVYNSAGTQVGVTADQTTPWASAGLQTMALTGGPFALTAGFYWVAVLSVGTTPPTMPIGANSFRSSNLGTAAAVARYATAGTGQTTLPGSFTPSANTLASNAVWAGLS